MPSIFALSRIFDLFGPLFLVKCQYIPQPIGFKSCNAPALKFQAEGNQSASQYFCQISLVRLVCICNTFLFTFTRPFVYRSWESCAINCFFRLGLVYINPNRLFYHLSAFLLAMRYSAALIALSASVLPTLASRDVQRRDGSARISNANTPPVTVKGNGRYSPYT